MKFIDKVIHEIREIRDLADGLDEKFLMFGVFLLCLMGVLLLGYLFVLSLFTAPKVCIPLYITIFVLWKGYNRL